MCRLKSKLLCVCCFVTLCLCSFSFSAETSNDEDDGFSRRVMVHESINGCIDTINEIRSGEISQEEGLDQLEETLDFVQFMTWYWIED